MTAEKLEQMAQAAMSNLDPKSYGKAKYDMNGVLSEMSSRNIDPNDLAAVSWVVFGEANIEARFGDGGLALIHPGGILVTNGVPSGMRKRVKAHELTFPPCKEYGATDTADPRNMGKYCIDFAGPGNVFLGRLEWWWTAGRFSDARGKMMASASERDRILAVVEQLF